MGAFMNKQLALASAALAVVLIAVGTARAADMAVKAPIVPPFSWTGWYVGENLGYGWASDPVSLTETTSSTSIISHDADVPNPTFVPGPSTGPTTASGSGNVNPNGVIGGIQGGYNLQSGSWVYGLEGDIQGSGQRGSTTICTTAGCPVGSPMGIATYSLPWFGTLRARLGFTPAPRWLVYATGGLAVGEIDESLSAGPVGGTPGFVFSSNTTRAGFAVGGGVETIIMDNWSLKLEYIFLGFGNVGGSGTGTVVTDTFNGPRIETITTTTTTGSLNSRIGENIVRVGVNYHFW
jgi:outer membrane immunogenic protein